MTWLERIHRAEKMGRFTVEDESEAGDWSSCATHERGLELAEECKQMNPSRGEVNHECSGSKGHRLGHQFHKAVADGKLVKAKRIYEEIQKLKP